MESSGIFEDYARKISGALERICREQRDKLALAAELAAGVIEADGLIYIFGCGHSGLMSCEGFYRAGGLACVAPVFCEPRMLHESAVRSSRLEKRSGYAEGLKERFSLEDRDMLICFSTSDKNAVPVEFAEYIAGLGVPTVAVCSSAYFGQQPHNSCGKLLHEVCSIYIDNLAPYGDACLSPADGLPGMAPLSTVTGAFILNSILAEAARIAAAHGAEPPVYLSGNIDGGAERNEALIRRYAARIPALLGEREI